MDEHQKVYETLLGREVVSSDLRLIGANTQGKSVLVTGAGGSIGSELCRQLVNHQPDTIVLFERSEYALYLLQSNLAELSKTISGAERIKIIPLLGSISNKTLVESTLSTYNVNVIYHTAAYKQVPMLEHNIIAGIQNNVFGTLVMAKAAEKFNVEKFILISTDKAVRPVNIMGATKRLAEQILQSLNGRGCITRFTMVRFGNVLGSSGSVLPLFQKQILEGGPVTVTHPEVTRYFMTVQEAVHLVIQAGAMARGGEVFVLDMKKPVRIADMAKNLIQEMGYEVCESCPENACKCPDRIPISYSGLREGEKLFEELLIGDAVTGTAHPKIMRAMEDYLEWKELDVLLSRLEYGCSNMDHNIIWPTLDKTIEGFSNRFALQDQPTISLEKENIIETVFEDEPLNGEQATLSH